MKPRHVSFYIHPYETTTEIPKQGTIQRCLMLRDVLDNCYFDPGTWLTPLMLTVEYDDVQIARELALDLGLIITNEVNRY